MYMLDTNICVFLINNKSPALAKRIADVPFEEVSISSITQSELAYGVAKSQHTAKNALALARFLSTLTVLAFDAEAAEAYGEIRAALERKGTVIGQFDMLIAAHAKAKGFRIVTNNTSEFMRVDGLVVEDWTK